MYTESPLIIFNTKLIKIKEIIILIGILLLTFNIFIRYIDDFFAKVGHEFISINGNTNMWFARLC